MTVPRARGGDEAVSYKLLHADDLGWIGSDIIRGNLSRVQPRPLSTDAGWPEFEPANGPPIIDVSERQKDEQRLSLIDRGVLMVDKQLHTTQAEFRIDGHFGLHGHGMSDLLLQRQEFIVDRGQDKVLNTSVCQQWLTTFRRRSVNLHRDTKTSWIIALQLCSATCGRLTTGCSNQT